MESSPVARIASDVHLRLEGSMLRMGGGRERRTGRMGKGK